MLLTAEMHLSYDAKCCKYHTRHSSLWTHADFSVNSSQDPTKAPLANEVLNMIANDPVNEVFGLKLPKGRAPPGLGLQVEFFEGQATAIAGRRRTSLEEGAADPLSSYMFVQSGH